MFACTELKDSTAGVLEKGQSECLLQKIGKRKKNMLSDGKEEIG